MNKLSYFFKTIHFSLLIFLCAFAEGNEIEIIHVYPELSVSQSPLSVMDETISLQSQLTPVSSISSLLSTLPSVGFNGQGGQFQVNSIRGVSRWRVLTRFNQAILHTDRRAGVSTSFIDPDFIKSISVRKGGTATQFGSGALSGVFSLNSEAFKNSWVATRAETNGNHLKASAGVNIADWSVGVSHAEQNNAKDPDDQPLNNQFKQTSLYTSRQWQLNADWNTRFVGLVSYGKDIGKTNNEDFLNSKHTIYPYDKHTLLQFHAHSNKQLQLGMSYHRQKLNTQVTRFEKRINTVVNQSDDLFFYLRKDWELSGQDTLSLNYEWDARFNVKTQEEALSLRTQLSTYKQALDGEQQTHAITLTWQKQWQDLTLLAGFRSNFLQQKNLSLFADQQQAHLSSESAHFNTGYINLNYAVSPKTAIVASTGTSFRFPTLSERFFAGTTGRGELIGNSALIPEKSLNTEIGIIHLMEESSIRAAIYHNDVENFIERLSITGLSIDEDIQQFQNRDSGSIYGVEAEWKIQLNPRWEYKVIGDWQRSTLNDSNSGDIDRLADTAPATVRSVVTFNNESYSIELQHNHRFAFNHPASGEVSLPSASTFAISVNWEVSDSVKIALWGNNLTNKTFLMTADDKSTTALGRRLGLSLYWQP